jgi:hypothetical protein
VDIDPVGERSRRRTNATDEEHQACVDLMKLILDKEPIISDSSMHGSSGNGAFIMTRVNDLQITPETLKLVKAFSNTLILKYGRAITGAKIDPGSSASSRLILCKLTIVQRV